MTTEKEFTPSRIKIFNEKGHRVSGGLQERVEN
jgi:hypothetical protein